MSDEKPKKLSERVAQDFLSFGLGKRTEYQKRQIEHLNKTVEVEKLEKLEAYLKQAGEKTGGNVNYYVVDITHPKRHAPYIAECEDIIEALGMTFAEGTAFKAIWRSCAARTLGKLKAGGNAVYDAEKVIYYGQRMLAQRRKDKDK